MASCYPLRNINNRRNEPTCYGILLDLAVNRINSSRTRVMTYIRMSVKENIVVEGIITFVNMDINGAALPYGVVITPGSVEDIALQERVRSFWV